MSSDLKPGDRCLVVQRRRCGCGGYTIGMEVVIAEPYSGSAVCRDCGFISHVLGFQESGTMAVFDARRLIRIPPDSEARQMFREAERPRENA